MSGLTTYGAVSTKIRGMRSHLLKTEDYKRLASCSSIKEIVVYLKNLPGYAEVLADTDPDDMHFRRENYERLILRSVFRDFAKISHFLDQKRKKFLTAYSIQYELRLINNVIRDIHNPYTDKPDLTIYRPMYEGSPNFDFDKVIAAKTMDELISALDESIYQEPLLRTRNQLEHPTLFDYETALNRYYFLSFWETVQKINSADDKNTLMEIHGTQIDLLNLIWIYRAKTYYKVTPQEIYGFLIPAYYHLKKSDVAKMIGAGDNQELVNAIARTRYGKYIDPNDPTSLEKAYTDHISHITAKTRREHPYSFAVIGAYAYDKKEEIDRIVSISESVRYGYDPKIILNALNIRGVSE